MTEFHSIRLHGPWNAKVLSFANTQPAADFELEKRVKIPSGWHDWLGPNFCGLVAYERSFNLPTRLQPAQKVWLVVEEVDFLAQLSLNETDIGTLRSGEPPLRIEVQQLLKPTNKLRIEIDSRPPANPSEKLSIGGEPSSVKKSSQQVAGGLIGAVRLEIEEPNIANA